MVRFPLIHFRWYALRWYTLGGTLCADTFSVVCFPRHTFPRHCHRSHTLHAGPWLSNRANSYLPNQSETPRWRAETKSETPTMGLHTLAGTKIQAGPPTPTPALLLVAARSVEMIRQDSFRQSLHTKRGHNPTFPKVSPELSHQANLPILVSRKNHPP